MAAFSLAPLFTERIDKTLPTAKVKCKFQTSESQSPSYTIIVMIIDNINLFVICVCTSGQNLLKQARKSSEDAQAAGYAQFEKVWAW